MRSTRPLLLKAAKGLNRILKQATPGQALPSEPALARKLGVSRATLREAMRGFEERGLILRRQGVGTFVRRPPVIDAGLEVLVSIDRLAAQIGLQVRMGSLHLKARPPAAEEIRQLGLEATESVLEISRVIHAGARPVAYLVDVVPTSVLSETELGAEFNGSVLDTLLWRGEPALDCARTEISAQAALPEIASLLQVPIGEVLITMQASLYTKAGAIIDCSQSYFLPGTFRFHVVRRVEAFPH